MRHLKYIDKLSDNQILELIKIYTRDEFKKLKRVVREEGAIHVLVEVECDYEDEEGMRRLVLEEQYSFTDYTVDIVDYYSFEEADLLREYREKLLDYFGTQYAIDFLLES